ncbi:MAG: hypothetical protein FP831_13390 [Anaerolineae bacterium]|nr:hypothetical protein [Anaerolineae bacterium]
MQTLPLHFYDDPIDVIFKVPPTYEKSPDCPQAFIWRGNNYLIIEVLEEWVDFERRGKSARNMKPTHAATARIRGSWGVGRYYFRVKTESEQYFELYYDRAPEDCDDRKGKWLLKGERKPTTAKE